MSQAWRQHWFPLAFRRDLEPGRVERIGLFDRQLALFLDAAGRPAVLVDRCPHRSARLSDGRLRDGTLECLYHGWRFDREGACVEAPQQPREQALPARARASALPVREEQGIVWAWGGSGPAPSAAAPPTVAAFERAGLHSIDFVMDLPYGQDAFVENVLDVAHIHVAHAGSRGGGDRRLAGPLEFELESEGPEGFSASFRTLGRESAPRTDGLRRAFVEYRAPSLVHFASEFDDRERVSGLALYSLPTGTGSSRMLYRAYGNLWSAADRARPRWVEHLSQCHLLEEDMAVVRGQVEEIDRSREPLAQLWLPLRTSDRLVLLHREWIERYAADRPGAVGLREVGERGLRREAAKLDRWSLHTRHCADCRAAHARASKLAQRCRAASFVALAAAAAASGPAAWSLAALALGAYGLGRRQAAHARALVLERDVHGRGPTAGAGAG